MNLIFIAFLIGFSLLILDIISTEIGIFKYNMIEGHPILRIFWIRWSLSIILKIYIPLYVYFNLTLPLFKLLLSLLYIFLYGILGINNIRGIYIQQRNLKNLYWALNSIFFLWRILNNGK